MRAVLRGLMAGVLSMAPALAPMLAVAALLPDAREVLARVGILTALSLGVGVASQVGMALLRPQSFENRRRSMIADKAGRQPLIDAVGIVGYVTYIMAWCAFAPFDAARLQLLGGPPAWAQAVGLAAAVAGQLIASAAAWQNAFAAPGIETQAGHTVISHGVYALVRHPLYAGGLLYWAGAALWIGSYAALAGVTVNLAMTLARIVIEERFLRDTLPDYAAYARRVRGRLIPYVL